MVTVSGSWKVIKASESGGFKLDLKQYLKIVKIKAGSNGISLPSPPTPRNSKIHPKIHVKSQGTLEAKNNIKTKNILRLFTLADFKTYYKARVITIVWYWHKDGYEDQWNRAESPQINSHAYAQMTFDKDVTIIQWGKDCLVNKWCLESRYPHLKEWNWTLLCLTYENGCKVDQRPKCRR